MKTVSNKQEKVIEGLNDWIHEQVKIWWSQELEVSQQIRTKNSMENENPENTDHKNHSKISFEKE